MEGVDELKILVTVDDLPDNINRAIEETLGWFDDEPRLNGEEFIDRLCKTYADGWDIESYDNPAVREILKRARKLRSTS